MDLQIINQVLEEFYKLCEIPHQPKNEKQLSDMLKKYLAEFSENIVQDDLVNIWADISASDGFENMPRIALQAHIDMVYAVGQNPDKTGKILTKIENGCLTTGGTSSLGADCGAGVAVIFWLLKNIKHCPLRIILTVQEEIGLVGASKISNESVENINYLINLDGFSANRLIIGAAGGMREHFSRPMQLVNSPAGKSYEITISGLSGGHSGFDIDKNRGNAVLILGEILRKLQTKTPFAVAYFEGGEAFNAIPYTASAKIITAISAKNALEDISNEILNRYKQTDSSAKAIINECERPEKVWSGELLNSVLTVLGGFANGVYQMHKELKNTVNDSSNLGRIYEQDGELCLDAMIRYMDENACQALHQSHILVAGMCGFVSVIRTHYPAWKAKTDGTMLNKITELYKSEHGSLPEILAQHVGLEPSYFTKHNKNLECICMGMDIYDCHAPSERLKLDSIPPFVRILSAFLQNP